MKSLLPAALAAAIATGAAAQDSPTSEQAYIDDKNNIIVTVEACTRDLQTVAQTWKINPHSKYEGQLDITEVHDFASRAWQGVVLGHTSESVLETGSIWGKHAQATSAIGQKFFSAVTAQQPGPRVVEKDGPCFMTGVGEPA